MLKSLLYTMLPTCKIYLDEDDADEDNEVEAQVEQASALLVFLTVEYVGSRKGMLRAIRSAMRIRLSATSAGRRTAPCGGKSPLDHPCRLYWLACTRCQRGRTKLLSPQLPLLVLQRSLQSPLLREG